MSRLIVFNANPHRITVTVPAGDGSTRFSIGACATATFTWDHGWKAVSGASNPSASEPQVYIYTSGPANEQGP